MLKNMYFKQLILQQNHYLWKILEQKDKAQLRPIEEFKKNKGRELANNLNNRIV
jgi:hypothetical protein